IRRIPKSPRRPLTKSRAMWVIGYQNVVRSGPVKLKALICLSRSAFVLFTEGAMSSWGKSAAQAQRRDAVVRAEKARGRDAVAVEEAPRARIIVFLGAPGSGKGTQSALLSAELGIAALSTGEMLRAEAQRETSAGRKLRKVLASGALVADELVCDAVAARLKREIANGGMILDGFPRTLAQAERLDGILRGLDLGPAMVLHLDVPREHIVARLTARRQCASCGAIYNLVSRRSGRGEVCESDGGALVQREDDSEP